jgi:hypothetical protein
MTDDDNYMEIRLGNEDSEILDQKRGDRGGERWGGVSGGGGLGDIILK